jgi:SAM-dependent methyltransferase
MSRADAVEAGQAVYSPLVLKIYDWFVLGFSNRLLWRCPAPHLRALYARNVSARHVDIGVGTGYFLDRVEWPVADPAVTLVDLNPNSLAAAAKRIARFRPRTVQANALAPLPPLGPFDSAGLCYLLHCLPGTIEAKAIVFDHLRPALAPGARVFGATILQGDAPRLKPAKWLMNLYNKKGIFSNAGDTRQALEAALKQRFTDVRIEMKGAVALFEARNS